MAGNDSDAKLKELTGLAGWGVRCAFRKKGMAGADRKKKRRSVERPYALFSDYPCAFFCFGFGFFFFRQTLSFLTNAQSLGL
jgi:hypothetical protein